MLKLLWVEWTGDRLFTCQDCDWGVSRVHVSASVFSKSTHAPIYQLKIVGDAYHPEQVEQIAEFFQNVAHDIQAMKGE